MHILTKTKDNRRAHSTVINISNSFTTQAIFYTIYIKLIKIFKIKKLLTVLASYCDNTMIKYFMTGLPSMYELVCACINACKPTY